MLNMTAPISNATHAVQAQPAPARQTSASAQAQAAPTDTVQLSGVKAVLQEAMETSVQTTKEAAGGDLQAQRLLAKEAAAEIK